MSLHSAPAFGVPAVDRFWTIAIVRSLWHDALTAAMQKSAMQELVRLGIPRENIGEIQMPGAFELPLGCKQALQTYDAVIACGVIVEGQTHHARLIADQAAAGLMQVQLMTGKPVTFEVLYVRDIRDAEARVHGVENVGVIAAHTVLSSLAGLTKIR
jgi:6,7-dimethyl-8-ribityllumazine synthase